MATYNVRELLDKIEASADFCSSNFQMNEESYNMYLEEGHDFSLPVDVSIVNTTESENSGYMSYEVPVLELEFNHTCSKCNGSFIWVADFIGKDAEKFLILLLTS